MKKLLLISVLALAFVLAGCGAKKETSTGPGVLDSMKGLKEATDLGKAMEKGSEQDATKALENLANLSADMEKKEFDKTEAVDAPSGFPSEFIYSSGKIVESNDDSSDGTKNLKIKIRTTDELAKVKDFYKKILAENGWKLTSQSNTSDGASLEAKKDDNTTVSADISTSQYSKLVDINVDYYQTSN